MGVLIFLLLSTRMAVPARAQSSENWAIGEWYLGYPAGGGGTSFAVNVYNYGLPGDSNGESFAVHSATVDGFLAQVAIENGTDKNGYLYECLLSLSTFTSGFGTNGCAWHQLSGLLGNVWHTIELEITTSQGGDADNMNWILDGTIYDTYVWTTCTPCSFTFDTEMAPQMAVESYDNSTTDLANMNVHGYFEYPAGTIVGSQYFYPAQWGACPPVVSQECPNGTGGSCPLTEPNDQTTNHYIGRDIEAPSNVGVTGHVYSGGSYGASDEWAIGNWYGSFNEVTDSDLSSSFCGTLPPQIA
jgi:hypothetical protein